MSAPDLSQQITDAASGPRSASSDGLSVTAQSPRDIADAEKYLAQREAARKKTLGLRFVRIKPPGTV